MALGIAFAAALTLLVFSLCVAWGSTAGEDRGDGDDPSDGGGGGGGRRRPPDQPAPPGADGPAWWPQFEAEFRAYVRRLEERRPLTTVSLVDVPWLDANDGPPRLQLARTGCGAGRGGTALAGRAAAGPPGARG